MRILRGVVMSGLRTALSSAPSHCVPCLACITPLPIIFHLCLPLKKVIYVNAHKKKGKDEKSEKSQCKCKTVVVQVRRLICSWRKVSSFRYAMTTQFNDFLSLY